MSTITPCGCWTRAWGLACQFEAQSYKTWRLIIPIPKDIFHQSASKHLFEAPEYCCGHRTSREIYTNRACTAIEILEGGSGRYWCISVFTWNHPGSLDPGLDCLKKLRHLRREGRHKHGLSAMPSPFFLWPLLPHPFAVRGTKVSWDKNPKGLNGLFRLPVQAERPCHDASAPFAYSPSPVLNRETFQLWSCWGGWRWDFLSGVHESSWPTADLEGNL